MQHVEAVVPDQYAWARAGFVQVLARRGLQRPRAELDWSRAVIQGITGVRKAE